MNTQKETGLGGPAVNHLADADDFEIITKFPTRQQSAVLFAIRGHVLAIETLGMSFVASSRVAQHQDCSEFPALIEKLNLVLNQWDSYVQSKQGAA